MTDQYWLNEGLGTSDDTDMASFLNFGDSQPPPPVKKPSEMANSPVFNQQQLPPQHQQGGARDGDFNHQNSINPSAILSQAARQDQISSGSNNNLIADDPQTIMNFRNANDVSRTSNNSRFSPQQQQMQFNESNFNNNPSLDKNAMMTALRQRQQQAQQQQMIQEQMKNIQAQQLLKEQMLQHAQQQQAAAAAQQKDANSNSSDNMNQLQQQFYQQLQQQRMQQMQQQSPSNGTPSAAVKTPSMPYQQVPTPQQQQQQLHQQQQIPSQQAQQPHQAAQVPRQASIPSNMNAQQAQAQAQAAQKRQRQMNQQLQLELFMKTLQDFSRKKGIALPQNPLIDGQKIHLFFLYVLVSKMGGSVTVTRNNQWEFIASKFQLNVKSNPSYAREIANFYNQYLFQFEQFASTQEGQREIFNIKMSIQKQIQQQQAQQQAQQQIPPQQQPLQSIPSQSPMQQSPMGMSPIMAQQQPALKKRRSTKGSKVSSPNFQPTPKQASRKPSNSSQASTPMSTAAQNLGRQLPLSASAPTPSIIQEEPPVDPNVPVVIRNYAPHQRLIELVGGYDVPSLIQLGEHVDAGKPFYLFAPELGNIDIHALTMSLTSGINSEVNNALNTLLVTAADHHLMLQLRECPELLDALCQVGHDVLDEIISGKAAQTFTPIVKSEELIDSIFQNHVKDMEKKEDLKIKVDSFTGDLVSTQDESLDKDEDEESEAGNDLFSIEESTTPSEVEEKIDIESKHFELPSYTEFLLASKNELENGGVKVFQKSSNNYQLMLIERLSTLSIILRNLSFIGNNNEIFAMNASLKEYFFKLVDSITQFPDKFMLAKKQISFLKDALIILSGIADSLQLSDHRQALLVIMLTLTFCEKFEDSERENDPLIIPFYNSQIQKYQPYAIDLFTKIVVRDPPNRELIKNVVMGIYPQDTEDSENEIYTLTKKYLKGKDPRDGVLVERLFTSIISILPIYSIDKFVPILEERKITIVQGLLSCILLTEMFNADDFKTNFALNWISSPEMLGTKLSKIGSTLSLVKPHNNQELVLISRRCLTLLNLLLERCMDFAKANDTSLEDLNKLPKLFPELPLVCAATANVHIESDVLRQLLRLSSFQDQVIALIK